MTLDLAAELGIQLEEARAEIARLRAALERIANLRPLSRTVDPHDSQARPRRMARRALSRS
jgi:hypothetical protein